MKILTELPKIDDESFARLSELLFGDYDSGVAAHRAARVGKFRRIMVTGAGGSIGGALCQRLMHLEPTLVVMYDNSEAALYRSHHAMKFDKRFVPIIGDVRDEAKLKVALDEYKIDLVFHAAALKHVDMLETRLNLIEAVTTNVMGTNAVVSASRRHGADLVVISTDKAVHPTSILGLTKRIGERIAAQGADKGTRISVVRFGNVMNSSGSAIPLFRRQIAAGGPVTITNTAMTRYMMTMGQAVDLVLASASGPSQLYVLDMGTPIKIVDLARILIRMDDKEPIKDIGIAEIGMRPGEKLSEELLYEDEAEKAQLSYGMHCVPLPENDDELWLRIGCLLLIDPLAAEPKDLMRALKYACPEYVG